MKLDLTGQRFGRLIVIARAENRGRYMAAWSCLCSCGTVKTVFQCHLRAGRSRSCGCWRREDVRQRRRIHGQSRTPLYRTWEGMLTRCENPHYRSWHRYGGRGISMCDEWRHNPPAFMDWALTHGWQPHLHIDRINNDGNYEPDNCRFVTNAENQRNRSPRAQR
jgi:hypothetical protein